MNVELLVNFQQFLTLACFQCVTFTGMGSNYYGQAMNMGQQFQQQGQQLMNQGQQISQQLEGKCIFSNIFFAIYAMNIKQSLDKVFVISRIIKAEEGL